MLEDRFAFANPYSRPWARGIEVERDATPVTSTSRERRKDAVQIIAAPANQTGQLFERASPPRPSSRNGGAGTPSGTPMLDSRGRKNSRGRGSDAGSVPPSGRMSVSSSLPSLQPRGSPGPLLGSGALHPMVCSAKPPAARALTLRRPGSYSSELTESRSAASLPPTDQEPLSPSAGLFEREYILGDEIGSGTFGSVHRAREVETGRLFAVKVAHIDERDNKDIEFCEKMKKELNIVQELRHPHIVAFLGHKYVDRRLHICFEYVEGGSLRHMFQEFGPLKPPLLEKATCGILEGLHYLHTQSPPVKHRDLKCANILVDKGFCVKLADFGCSKRDSETLSETMVGTPSWMAPEVVQQAGETGHRSSHGRKADIWSFGCVVIEMATAADPWGKGTLKNWIHAMDVIRTPGRVPAIPEVLPTTGREFVSHCLQRSPSDRPHAAALLRLEFVSHLRSASTPHAGPDEFAALVAAAPVKFSARSTRLNSARCNSSQRVVCLNL